MEDCHNSIANALELLQSCHWYKPQKKQYTMKLCLSYGTYLWKVLQWGLLILLLITTVLYDDKLIMA